MTVRRDMERRIATLEEIREIMESMKVLSLMEARKLTGFLGFQQRVVDGIEAAAADFLAFHPGFAEPQGGALSVWIIIGSERGFCGDFNEALAAAAIEHLNGARAARPRHIVIGRKLAATLQDRLTPDVVLDGPGAVEDVPNVLLRVVEAIGDFPTSASQAITLVHRGEDSSVTVKPLLPPFLDLRPPAARLPYPPRLYLPPGQFYSGLVEQYVFALLHEAFYISLMGEHRQRIRHLEAAINHLGDRVDALGRRLKTVRQEEITEEIELLMLSARSARRG